MSTAGGRQGAAPVRAKVLEVQFWGRGAWLDSQIALAGIDDHRVGEGGMLVIASGLLRELARGSSRPGEHSGGVTGAAVRLAHKEVDGRKGPIGLWISSLAGLKSARRPKLAFSSTSNDWLLKRETSAWFRGRVRYVATELGHDQIAANIPE